MVSTARNDDRLSLVIVVRAKVIRYNSWLVSADHPSKKSMGERGKRWQRKVYYTLSSSSAADLCEPCLLPPVLPPSPRSSAVFSDFKLRAIAQSAASLAPVSLK